MSEVADSCQSFWRLPGCDAESLSDIAVVEKPAKMEGRSMAMFISPKPAR